MSLLQKALDLTQSAAASAAPPSSRIEKDAHRLLETIENIYHIKDLSLSSKLCKSPFSFTGIS